MKISFKYFLLSALLIGTLHSCKTDTTPDSPPDNKPARKVVKVPSFNGDSAYAYVAKQVDFGPRLPNTEGHRACAKWMVETLESFGAKVTQQDFLATSYYNEKLRSKNIIASFNPKAKNRVLLCAHWDTRHIADWDPNEEKQDDPILGADDGGSGVGVLLEVARIIGQDSLKTGVDIILFDAEDHGKPSGEGGDGSSWCLGSQYWARNPHMGGYNAKFGILLDMVGSKTPQFPREGTSMKYAPQVMTKVWQIATEIGYGGYFNPQQTRGVIDDHLFINEIANIPTIDIINRDMARESGFGAHWHTHDDNMDVISKNSLKAVGQVVLTVVYREDAGEF